MRVEMLKPYSMFAVGELAELDPPIATLLIQRGVAAAVAVNGAHPPSGAVAVDAVDSAVPVPGKRRRTRRAKSEILQPES